MAGRARRLRPRASSASSRTSPTLLAAHSRTRHLGRVSGLIQALVEDVVQDPEQVLGHLDQLAQLDELTGPVDYARFLDTVRAEIQALKAGDLERGNQGALGLRGVSVLDVNALRHLRFRAVAVLGLTERSFPPPPRQDPLLLDDEREALNNGGRIRRCPCARAGPTRSRSSSRSPSAPPASGCCSRTRRAAEAGARAQLPSSFFRAASAPRRAPRAGAEIERLPFVRRFRAGRSALAIPTARSPSRARPHAARATGPRPRRAGAPAAAIVRATRTAGALGNRVLTPFDGVFVSPEAIEALRACSRRAACSRRRRDVRGCPYRFFLERPAGQAARGAGGAAAHDAQRSRDAHAHRARALPREPARRRLDQTRPTCTASSSASSAMPSSTRPKRQAWSVRRSSGRPTGGRSSTTSRVARDRARRSRSLSRA